MSSQAKDLHANERSRPWKMLGWLLATQILVAFVGRSVAPLGVVIGEDLVLTKAQIGMLPAALFFGQAFVSIPAGFLVDRIGTRHMLLIVAAVLGGGFIVMTFTSVFVIVLIMIAIAGSGYGAGHPATNRGIILWFPIEKRGVAMGIKQMGVTFGSALAALLLLPVAGEWGWRPAVLSASILLILVGGLSFVFFREPIKEQKDEKIKSVHFLPELMQMLKHHALVLVSLSAMFLQGSQMILNTYIVLFAYEKIGISLFLSGLLLVVSEVGGSAGRVVWGIVSDRYFHSKRIIILMIISILTMVIATTVAFLPANTSFFTLVPITLSFGFCVSGFNAIWMNATTEIVPESQSGIATGFSLTVGATGVIIGPPLFGLIVDYTGTYTVGWLFIAFMMLIVFTLLAFARKIVNKSV